MEEIVESDENISSLHTEKAVKGSYRMCQRHSFYRKPQQKDLTKKWRKGRDPSPDGEAPIYPTNPSDSEPECMPTEVQSSSGKCKVQVVLCLVAGYILGILLVLIWYYQNPQRASTDLGGTWLFLIFCFPLLLIMLQRRPSRCIAVLCFPTLAHYQSRAVMVALAFLIALSGPVRNIIQNLYIMAHSLSCGQNQLLDALGLMHRLKSDPLQSMEESFQRVIDEVRLILTKLDRLFVKLEQPIAHIYATYRTSSSWLVLQNDHFDNWMGAPYTRCLRAGNLSIFQCQSEFEAPERDCCNQELFAWFCESLEGLKSFFGNNLQLPQIEDIFQRLQICFLKIRLMFIATISFDDSAKPNTSVVTERDHIYNQEMKNHLEATRHKFFYVSLWLYLMVFILLLSVILRSIDFRVRYLMSEHFDNVYITEEFEVYEEQQSQIMGVQVLPLDSCEENKYVKITSVKLLPNELKTMYRSGIFLFITGIQLYCLCLVDYSLYSLLVLMSLHGNKTADVHFSPDREIVFKGGGKIGDILRDFVHTFEPKTFQMESNNCHSVPGKPKNFRYFWISMVYVMAWIMVFLEPYGLRHRHRIMGYFYPEQCKRRVQYLHYRILKERKSAFQRSCQRAPYLNCYLYDNKLLSCISYLSSLTNWFFGGCRVAFIGRSCTTCRKRLTTSDYVFCASPNCPAVYCNICFNESNNICILCGSPWECDFSEIGDSSDDSDYSYCSPDNVQCP